MPVDDAELTRMWKNAKMKLNYINTELSQLRQYIAGCEEIIKVPKEDDPKVMRDVMDKRLGIKMSVIRRQEIYDKLLTDKTTLGL